MTKRRTIGLTALAAAVSAALAAAGHSGLVGHAFAQQPAPGQPLQLGPAGAAGQPGGQPPRPPGAAATVAQPVPARPGQPAPGRGTVAAIDPASREALARVNAAFNALLVASGDFVQIAPDGSRQQGRFYMQKPGKVRFDYDPPSPIEFISDGGAIAVRDRKLATQDVTPLSQTPLRFLLAERIDLLKDAPVVAVNRDDLFITVTLEEKHPLAGTHRLMLMFSAQDAQLKQWTVTDPQGFDTTVAIYNIDTSRRPSPDLFKINYERMLQ